MIVTIDLSIIATVIAACLFFMGIGTFLVEAFTPGSLDGSNYVALGNLSQFAAYLVLSGFSVLPDYVLIIMGNGFVLLSATFFYIGLKRILNIKSADYFPYIVPAITIILLIIFRFGTDNYSARVIVTESAYVIIMFAGLLLLNPIKDLKNNISHLLISIDLLFLMTLYLSRSVLAIIHYGKPAEEQFFNSYAVEVMLASFVGMVLMNYAYLLMANAKNFKVLANQAERDSLTGLLNRRVILEFLEHAIINNTNVTVLLIDLDFLKELNDQQGHNAGDAALCAVADASKSVLRQTDKSGRLGGDEFIIVLPNTSLGIGESIAKRLLEAINQAGYSVSIGVAENVPVFTNYKDFINKADMALYNAKKLGRNQYSRESDKVN